MKEPTWEEYWNFLNGKERVHMFNMEEVYHAKNLARKFLIQRGKKK